MKLIDSGRVRKALFIISSFFNQTKKPERWAIMLKEYCQDKPDKTKHIYCHNHSKVCLIRSQEDYYVFEGSGNMSDNARIEQYLYENNRQAYAFHKGWMLDLVNAQK